MCYNSVVVFKRVKEEQKKSASVCVAGREFIVIASGDVFN